MPTQHAPSAPPSSTPRGGANARAINLEQARHPLLNQETVVPIDVVMDKGTRVLVITGPNTGGKTVALKTIGLLSAMNQCGVARPGSIGHAAHL